MPTTEDKADGKPPSRAEGLVRGVRAPRALGVSGMSVAAILHIYLHQWVFALRVLK